MNESIHYKGQEIEPRCGELADGSGWMVGCNIIIHHGDATTAQGYDSDLVKPTIEEAEDAAIQLGMRTIDRSAILSNSSDAKPLPK